MRRNAGGPCPPAHGTAAADGRARQKKPLRAVVVVHANGTPQVGVACATDGAMSAAAGAAAASADWETKKVEAVARATARRVEGAMAAGRRGVRKAGGRGL